MKIHEYFNQCVELKKKTGWRMGQACFNHLLSVNRDLAEKVRATQFDPFYWEVGDKPYQDFCHWLEENWTK